MVFKFRDDIKSLPIEVKDLCLIDRQTLEITKLARMKLRRYFQFSRDKILTVCHCDSGWPYAGIVFYEAKHGDAKVMVWATSPIWREFIDEIKERAFKHYSRLTAEIPESNKKGIALAEEVGFVYEGTLRRHDDGENVKIYGMLKDG